MKKLGTQISPTLWLVLKDTADRQGLKLCTIVEEGIRLWLAENDRRKRNDTSEAKQLI